MMLFKRLNSFLCIGLVRCMDPDWGWDDVLATVRAQDHIPWPQDHFALAAPMSYVITSGEKDKILDHLKPILKSHIGNCKVARSKNIRAVYPGHEIKFINLDSGETIDGVINVNVYARHGPAQGQETHIVRVVDHQSRAVLDQPQLLTALKPLFSAFHEAITQTAKVEADRINEYQMQAANWLWNILTKHDSSLPIFGLISPGTAPEDFKFSQLKLDLIQTLSEDSARTRTSPSPKQIALANKLATIYCDPY